MVNNKNRARMVPEDILLQTHEGASNTIWGLVTKALPKGMNGRVDVILNNPEHTVFHTDADGKTIKGKVKGFKSLPLKKAKGGIYPEALWKKILFTWVKDNAPDTITANMNESVVNEAVIPKPIQSLIDYMVTNKIQRKVVDIKDKSKHDIFMKHVKIAIDKKLLMVKHNPIKHSEMSISLGPAAQKMIESVITEKQFKGLDGIDDKTPLTKISDVQKLKIIQSTGNIISFFVPKGFDRNFWQVISKGKIKKGKSLAGDVVYTLPGKMIGSPQFKSVNDLIKGVDWKSVERARRFNESIK